MIPSFSSSELNRFVLPVDAPQDDDFSTSISVHSYRVVAIRDNRLSRDWLEEAINRSLLKDEEFGIYRHWSPPEENPRAMWMKLGNRVRSFADTDGTLRYFQLARLVTGTAVSEFQFDGNHMDMIVYGGDAQVLNELTITLEQKFLLRSEKQSLPPEAIRRIFLRYITTVKRVEVDPQLDPSWGKTQDAKLSSRRGFIDPKSPVMISIRENANIVIWGFKSELENMYVEGMARPIKVSFEVNDLALKIYAPSFAVSTLSSMDERQVFYDLTRLVYSTVVADEKWITEETDKPLQLTFLGENPEEFDLVS